MQNGRKTIQLLVLLSIITLTLRNLLGYTKSHCESYCPSGALEGIIFYIKNNAFLCALSGINLILFISVIISVILVGRAFCSWICPVGMFVEFLSFIGRKSSTIIKDFWNIKVGKILSYLRYIVLAIILYASFVYADLIFRPFCIFYVVFSGQDHEIEWWSKWVMLVIIFSMLFIPFLWCRFICPLGTFLSLLRRFSFFYLHVNVQDCNKCNVCSNICPQQINVAQKQLVRDADCTSCLICVDSCPQNAIVLREVLFKRALPKIIVPLFVVLAMSAGVIMAFNYPIPTITKKFKMYSSSIQLEKADIIVKGMRCRGKANTVFWILEDVLGIAYLEAYASENRLRVYYDPNKVRLEDIINIIKNGKIFKNSKTGTETLVKFNIEKVMKH